MSTKVPKTPTQQAGMARHRSWQKQKSQRVCADLSPLPRRLTSHTFCATPNIIFLSKTPRIFAVGLSRPVEAYLLSMGVVRICIEFGRLDLWRSNGASFGHLTFRFNIEIQSRIIFSLLTFSFYQRESKLKPCLFCSIDNIILK